MGRDDQRDVENFLEKCTDITLWVSRMAVKDIKTLGHLLPQEMEDHLLNPEPLRKRARISKNPIREIDLIALFLPPMGQNRHPVSPPGEKRG